MVYLRCPGCRLKLYRTAVPAPKPCPACGLGLVLQRGDPPGALRSTPQERRGGASASVAELLELHGQIAARVRRGGSLAQVEREIITPTGLDRAQLAALRRYARGRLRRGAAHGPPSAHLEVQVQP